MLIYIANLRCMGKLAANSDPECPLGGTYPKKSYIQICSKNIHTVLGGTAILGFSQYQGYVRYCSSLHDLQVILNVHVMWGFKRFPNLAFLRNLGGAINLVNPNLG